MGKKNNGNILHNEILNTQLYSANNREDPARASEKSDDIH